MVPRASEGQPPPPRHAAVQALASPHAHKYRSRSPFSGHSNEADDERSTLSSFASEQLMGPVLDDVLEDDIAPALYPGEDTRPTSTRELLGFYAYSWAGEVFVTCGLGAFIPITLEELARASPTAVLADDRSQPCGSPDPITALMARAAGNTEGAQCVFNLLGAEINTASFAMYTFSISVLLQALVVVTMSGAADHGRYRKTLLLVFALVGALATMLFIFVVPSIALVGSLWAIIGNVCFGASFVLLNSFLPLLVRNHPDAKQARMEMYQNVSTLDDEHDDDDDHDTAYEPPATDVIDPITSLLPSSQQSNGFAESPSVHSTEMQLSTKISSYGVGIGYLAAVIVQLLSLVLLKTAGASLFSLRLVLFVVGLWWLCFTIPAAFLLRPRPGPPLSTDSSGKSFTWLGYLTYSWKNLGSTMMRARKLKDVLLFLAAWFMISDAIATVSGTAILFAKTTLGMDAAALSLVNVVSTVAGIIGALTWSKISRMMQWQPSQTILACICLFELIPIYGLLGYIPAIRRFGAFGMQQPWEMYPVGALYGLVLGGLSSYCRSLFGELIPPGNEAAFYALFAVTDKGSSIFGPAVVGAITDATGDIRPAFGFLAVLIGLPIPIMIMVNVERGKLEGAKLAREILPLAAGSLAGHDEQAIDDARGFTQQSTVR